MIFHESLTSFQYCDSLTERTFCSRHLPSLTRSDSTQDLIPLLFSCTCLYCLTHTVIIFLNVVERKQKMLRIKTIDTLYESGNTVP